MKIECIRLIEFDEIAERTRIESNFEGATRQTLLACLNYFVALNWDSAHEVLKTLTQDELEGMSPVLYDIMLERADRNKLRRTLQELPEAQLDEAVQTLKNYATRWNGSGALQGYPVFKVGAFAD